MKYFDKDSQSLFKGRKGSKSRNGKSHIIDAYSKSAFSTLNWQKDSSTVKGEAHKSKLKLSKYLSSQYVLIIFIITRFV